MLENIFLLPTHFIVIFIAMMFVLGAVIGSFLNVVILRLPRHEPISGIGNRSHCMSCGQTLKNIDLIPIFSYIFLGGKCRFCKSKISPRYWIVETTTALLFVLALIAFGITYKLAFAVVLIPALVVASGIDIDQMEIPYGCSILIALLGAVMTVLALVGVDNTIWYDHLIGAVIVAVPFALLALFGAMGGGDVQLMAASGLLLGWNIIDAAAIGCVLGAIGGSIEMLSVPKGTKKDINDKVLAIAEEWYSAQLENGCQVAEKKTEALYGMIFKGKTDIEADIIDEKIWSAVPDIKALNDKLTEELGDYTKFSVSIIIEHEKIKSVTCKKSICFGPYLAAGVALAFMFGDIINSWYLGFFN